MKPLMKPAVIGHVAMLLGGAALLAGCASVLPTTLNKTESRWTSYGEAKGAFDVAVVDHTTAKDLKSLGFTPEAAPNVRILNYVDVVSLFGSAFRLQDLPGSVKTCVEARDACYAYVVKVQDIKAKRDGNVASDLFGFRKTTHTTGWEFQATFVLLHDMLVYKLWNGTPEIKGYEKQITPLGPMQNLGGMVPKGF